MIPALLSVIIAFSIMATAVGNIVFSNIFVSTNLVKSEQTFNIAEAGINYYMWHLDYNSTDYEDGHTNVTQDPNLGYGPFVHQYIDQNNVDEGTFTLWIKPPVVNGSTIVTVTSIGQLNGDKQTRTIQAQIGSPSFASFGVASDSALWFGNTETADGPIFSNQGIRMDGPNTSTVTSANSTYVPSYSLGGDGVTSEPGVWCSTTVTSPVDCSTRSKSSWIYPASNIDFNQVNSSLCNLKKIALSNSSATSAISTNPNACTQTPTTMTSSYLPRRSFYSDQRRGYLIQLNSDDTYNLYDVNNENDTLTPYTSALSLSLVNSNIPIPSSGVIFAEDNVWVISNPTFGGRVTIAAGRMTARSTFSEADISIAGPLLYNSKDGSDAIGLVAQNSVRLEPYAPPASGAFNFEVDGALIAINGNVWYPGVYRNNPYQCTRGWTAADQQFLFYGSVATRQTWTWTWLDGPYPCGDAAYDPVNGYISGIENNTTQYDYNLEFNPPPHYPDISGNSILNWREILTRP